MKKPVLITDANTTNSSKFCPVILKEELLKISYMLHVLSGPIELCVKAECKWHDLE